MNNCLSAKGINENWWKIHLSKLAVLSSQIAEFLQNTGDDDGAVHARLREAGGGQLPPAGGPRDGGHGGQHPDQERRAPKRHRPGTGALWQRKRTGRRARRHLGRPPRAGAPRPADLRAHGQAQPGAFKNESREEIWARKWISIGKTIGYKNVITLFRHSMKMVWKQMSLLNMYIIELRIFD